MERAGKSRSPALGHGWYPHSAPEISDLTEEWTRGVEFLNAHSVVCPHAGWLFSGKLAAMAIKTLKQAETIVVFGGHLSQKSPVLYAEEESFETASGILQADQDLLAALAVQLRDSGINKPEPDRYVDNSVEVLLPMIAALCRGASILWLRIPPRLESKELGACVARAALAIGKKVACIGSTDLTHYGPAYGFMPAGLGEKARRWVSGTNDKLFLDALLDMNCEMVLSRAMAKGSACSPGAAVAALGFALESGAESAKLIGYSTSLEVRDDDSFVGYGAIAFI